MAHLCNWSGRVMATPIHPPRIASAESFFFWYVSGTRPSADKEPTSARTGDGAAKGTLGTSASKDDNICQQCAERLLVVRHSTTFVSWFLLSYVAGDFPTMPLPSHGRPMRRARKFASNPPGDLRSPCWPFKTLSSGWNYQDLTQWRSHLSLGLRLPCQHLLEAEVTPLLSHGLSSETDSSCAHTICVNLSWCSPLQIPDAACIWSFNPSKPILVVKMFKGMRPLLRTTRAAPREQQGRCWASTAVSHAFGSGCARSNSPTWQCVVAIAGVHLSAREESWLQNAEDTTGTLLSSGIKSNLPISVTACQSRSAHSFL